MIKEDLNFLKMIATDKCKKLFYELEGLHLTIDDFNTVIMLIGSALAADVQRSYIKHNVIKDYKHLIDMFSKIYLLSFEEYQRKKSDSTQRKKVESL